MNVYEFLYCCAVTILLSACTTANHPLETTLYEGSMCKLENGTDGVCKILPECPSRLAEVLAGRRDATSNGRCGFVRNFEIVCCPLQVDKKIGVRRAQTACEGYENGPTTERTENRIDVDQIPEKDKQLTYHIVGGTRTAPGEFPYMASLGYENTDGEIDFPIAYDCGGTLISSQYVLTAAHCITNVNQRSPIVVRIGSDDLRSTTSSAQEIPIAHSIPHPRYKQSAFYNDIALVKLATPAIMSASVKAICLQTRALEESNIDENTSFVVIGFGLTALDEDKSDKLMKTGSLNLVPTPKCAESYMGFSKLPKGLIDSQICALDHNITHRSDACQGDSGGPLLMMSATRSTLAGVTSLGQSCGGSSPAVYTSVYSYLDWIESIVWPEQVKT